MKIGTLSPPPSSRFPAVGGGLAVYVAVTKYQTMDKVSVAQSRLEVVRARRRISRAYMNPERGFATNILYRAARGGSEDCGAELNEKYRKNTDGARDKMNADPQEPCPAALDDGAAVGTGIDALNAKFATPARGHGQGDRRARPEARKDAARKIVADNAVFNTAVTTLLDEQVRKHGACSTATPIGRRVYANIAWTLRDVGGLQCQPAQEPRRRQARRHRCRKDGFQPLARAAPTRS